MINLYETCRELVQEDIMVHRKICDELLALLKLYKDEHYLDEEQYLSLLGMVPATISDK